MLDRGRRLAVPGLLAGVAALTVLVLRAVVWTVFLAISVAYVLYPLRQRLRREGVGRRLAALASTLVALVAVAALFLPIAHVLSRRRTDIARWLGTFPDSVTLSVAGFEYVVAIESLVDPARAWFGDLAISIAAALPSLSLHLAVFVVVIYALMLRPSRVRAALVDPVPAAYHDVVYSLHRRLRDVLYALYGIQAVTALGTAAIAYPIFLLFGYPFAVTLAVVCGLLQFVPVLGPSLLLLGVGASSALAGDLAGAATFLAVSLVLVGLVPDALLRPRLARYTTGMPASLYFVGFTGGVLSVGFVGVIAGPVAIALLAETVRLLVTESRESRRSRRRGATGSGE